MHSRASVKGIAAMLEVSLKALGAEVSEVKD